MNKTSKILITILLALTLSGCKTLDTFKDEKDRDGIKETSLIDREKIVTEGEESIEKNVDSGPKQKVLKKPSKHARENVCGNSGRFFEDYCNWKRIVEFKNCIINSQIKTTNFSLLKFRFRFLSK